MKKNDLIRWNYTYCMVVVHCYFFHLRQDILITSIIYHWFSFEQNEKWFLYKLYRPKKIRGITTFEYNYTQELCIMGIWSLQLFISTMSNTSSHFIDMDLILVLLWIASVNTYCIVHQNLDALNKWGKLKTASCTWICTK